MPYIVTAFQLLKAFYQMLVLYIMKSVNSQTVMKQVAILAVLFVLTCGHVMGQDTAGLAFLGIGTNAAAGAMGDAQVSNSRDAYSTYWNPAGLAAAQSNSAALSHHIWVAQSRVYSLAARFNSGKSGGLGLFLTALDSGSLESRENPGPPDGNIDVQFISVGASYGRSFGPVRLGATVKYLSERIPPESATGYAFDFGFQADFLNEGVKVGAALQNIGEMNELNEVATELPRTLRAGVSVYPFRVLAMADGSVLLNAFLTGEISHIYASESTRYHLGLAAEVVELVTVRAGYIAEDELRGITFGGGLGSNGFLFDYAFMPFDNGFGSGHILSLLYLW